MRVNHSLGPISMLWSKLSGFAVIVALLLPMVAAAGGGTLDHFQGYPVSADSGLDGPLVQIDDQFGSQTTDLGRPIRFLVPADKNDEGISDDFSHLTCYEIVDGVGGPPVISTNQFGVQQLTLGVPDSLCVPTEKLITPGPIAVDHYKCYAATGPLIGAGISLQDQFQARSSVLLAPKLFCTPADKNGEGIVDPVTHLTCYDTDPVGQAPGPVPIQNQIAPESDIIELLGPDTLCVPSTKQLLPEVDHFTVYDATGSDGPTVTMTDQFGTQTTDLGLTNLFMVPADKNGEGIVDPFSHLTCYELLESQVGLPDVTVTNQFATDAPLTVNYSTEFCVPTEKLLTPGRVSLDHFRCDDVSGDPVDINVGLVDQFQGFTTLVGDPWRLCNPADKNGEGIANPDDHLVCYLLEPPGGTVGGAIPILNQFFPVQTSVDIGAPFALCAPSAKTVPEPAFVLGLGSGLLMLGALDRRRRRRAEREAATDGTGEVR